MSSTTATYYANKATNMSQLCNAPGCKLLRGGLDSHCGRHRSTYRRLGHPDAKPLPRHEWLPYKVALDKLFSLNQAHAGLLEAERYVETFMQRALADVRAYKGADQMQRLATAGITARDVLVTVLAVIEHQRHTRTPAPDDRTRNHELSRAVFALSPQAVKHGWRGTRTRPYRGRPAHSALVYVGRHLRGALAEFAAVVSLGLEAQQRAASMTADERHAARTAPMVIDYRP